MSCDVQSKINIMGYGAAGVRDVNKNGCSHGRLKIHIYQENAEIANTFC